MSINESFFSVESEISQDMDNISDFSDNVNDERECREWRAVLVEGQCQSGKTFRVNQLLKEKIKPKSETLVLIVTQATNNAAAIQTLERAQSDLADIIKIKNMFKSKYAPEDICKNDNYLVVDCWYSSNMENMKRFAANFKKVIIVIDEADQGGYKGISARIAFVSDIERIVPDCRLFLVTATTANLSNNIMKIATNNDKRYRRGTIVHDILYEEVVEYQNVKPSSEYIGTARMIEEGIRYLQFKTKASMKEDEDYVEYKKNTLLKKIKGLPYYKKEFTLIATSTSIEDHNDMVQPLMNVGYNVVVKMNGINKKNYEVSYMSNGKIKQWQIPTKEIYQLANDGSLASIVLLDDDFDTGIVSQQNCSLPDILQASLFMGTKYKIRIKENVSNKTYMKLTKIYSAIKDMKINKRPNDYPEKPYVALVVGNLASRGITIQDPSIDLVCTSFVFTDLNDTSQRGAQSTQKFGRACGNLFCKYQDERIPIVIATRKIVESALANYNAVNENSKNIKNGEYINLRYYISQEDWKGYRSDAKEAIKAFTGHTFENTKMNLVDKLKKYMNPELKSLIARMFRYLYNRTKDGSFISIKEFKEGVDYEKCDFKFDSNIRGALSTHSYNGKLWTLSGTRIQIYKNIIQLVEKIMEESKI